MKKLLLLALVALLGLIAGCDREKYAAHRTDRSKPKVAIGDNTVMVRRMPYPSLEILPDGGLRVDDIAVPVNERQRELLRNSFVQLQILRQNTITDSTSEKRSKPVSVPPNMQPFPPELIEQVPEFKEYGEALGNLRAEP